MTDLSWLDAIEARQRKHGGVTASDIARLVKALRDAHAKLARVEALLDGSGMSVVFGGTIHRNAIAHEALFRAMHPDEKYQPTIPTIDGSLEWIPNGHLIRMKDPYRREDS